MTDMKLFMKKLGLPDQAQQEFLRVQMLLEAHGAGNRLDEIAAGFFRQKDCAEYGREHYLASLETVNQLADSLSVSGYTMDFLYLMTCAELLLKEYHREQLPEALFWDTMSDLTCKLHECRQVHQVWGTFVARWYYIFWTRKLFKLGRLEYEEKEFLAEQYKKGDLELSKDDRVYTIHIPSEGPLRREDVLASLKKAYTFFGFRDRMPAPFVCHSWLLYPANETIFPENSNLMQFYRLFDVIRSEPDESFADCWRVFGVPLGSDPAVLPQTNTLQKNIVRHLLSGASMGMGYGILVFDGESLCL